MSQSPSTDQTPGQEANLDVLVNRVNRMVADATGSRPTAKAAPKQVSEDPKIEDAFVPREPTTLRASGMTESQIETLILKLLLARSDMVGRDVADRLRLPFMLVEQSMRQMKDDRLLVYRDSAPMNDYLYQLTDIGRERAKRLAEHCTYFGSAPVPLTDYIASVQAQTLTKQYPTHEELGRAFADLLIPSRMLARLGPAVNSGRGMFLYGFPGNGKTSIAERVTKAFGEHIWIPRALGVDGEIIRLFDPLNHEEASGGALCERVAMK